MEFQKVLETRRTVRKYSAGVTREQMEELRPDKRRTSA